MKALLIILIIAAMTIGGGNLCGYIDVQFGRGWAWLTYGIILVSGVFAVFKVMSYGE